MNPFTKQNILTVALALTLGPWQSSAFAASPGTFSDPVLATGKGFAIKRSQLDDAFISYTTSVAARGETIPENRRTDIRSNLLQHLIFTQILLQKATSDDKAKTKKMVDENIEQARKSAPSPAAFDASIRASGMTLTQVRDRALEEQVCRRVLERETTNGLAVSDAEARKFYDENPSKFEEPERVRVSHILISTLDPATQRPLSPEQKKAKEKLAKEIRARAASGEDFGKLVKQYSEDPGSKDKGGEYVFPRGQMVKEFESAAFSMKTNQISDLVETQFGFHIIKLLEKFPPKHEQFAEAEPKIKAFLIKKQAEKALPLYLDKIKAQANVVLLNPDTGKPM